MMPTAAFGFPYFIDEFQIPASDNSLLTGGYNPGMPAISITERLPSREAWRLLCTASVLIVNFWSIINFLRWVPALLLRMEFPAILTVFAYVQAFALFESVVVWLGLVTLGAALPRRAFGDHWPAKGAVFLFLTGLSVMVVHYLPRILPVFVAVAGSLAGGRLPELTVIVIGTGFFLSVWLSSYLILLRWSFRRIQRVPSFAAAIAAFLERAGVLAALFTWLDAAAVVWALARFPYGGG